MRSMWIFLFCTLVSYSAAAPYQKVQKLLEPKSTATPRERCKLTSQSNAQNYTCVAYYLCKPPSENKQRTILDPVDYKSPWKCSSALEVCCSPKDIIPPDTQDATSTRKPAHQDTISSELKGSNFGVDSMPFVHQNPPNLIYTNGVLHWGLEPLHPLGFL